MPGISKAVKEHRKVVSSWCPQTSVWALAHGATMSCLCVAGSSYMILIRMRQFFNLYSQQYFLGTLLPVVALPSVGYIILQDVFVDRKLITGFSSPEARKSLCSTCVEIRGSFIQVSILLKLCFMSALIYLVFFLYPGCEIFCYILFMCLKLCW